jgi:formate dehydrogenase major subunit
VPDGALIEKSIVALGQAEKATTTTCAYCGVGCSFKAESKGDGADRDRSHGANRDGDANHGHACVKGRFGTASPTHKDRVTTPLIRKSIHDPWKEATLGRGVQPYAASEFKRIQAKYGKFSVGGSRPPAARTKRSYLCRS